MYNAFDAKYRTKNNIDYNVNNLAIYSISTYLGIGPIFVSLEPQVVISQCILALGICLVSVCSRLSFNHFNNITFAAL